MGGYKIIDFKNKNFTKLIPISINNIYKPIKESKKALKVINITISNIEYNDVFIDSETLVIGETYVTFDIYNHRFTIDENNFVTMIK